MGYSTGIILAAVLTAVASAALKEPTPPTLQFIGSADGKLLFKGSITSDYRYTWQEAKDICAASNLKLASIETVGQADLVKQALVQHPGIFSWWTSGREARTTEAFIWDEEGTIDRDLFFAVSPPYGGYTNCVNVRVSTHFLYFQMRPCEEGVYGLLCQSH